MRSILLSTVLLLCVLNFAKSEQLRTGGFSTQELNFHNKKLIHSIEDHIISTSNDRKVLEVVNDAGNRGKIVHYATQVVAGINHLVVYRIVPEYDGARLYSCIKVYEDLQGHYSVSKAGSGFNMQDLESACDVIINHTADPSTDL